MPDFGDHVEEKPVAAGTEAKVRIMSVRLDNDKNGLPYMLPTLEVVDEPYCPEFTHFIRWPSDEVKQDQGEKAYNRALGRLKNFLEAFDWDVSQGFESEDAEKLVGNMAWAILDVEQDEQYGDRNRIKKLVGPA
jgi:hypothetical protein